MQDHNAPEKSLFASHPRRFDVNRYVYPVLSRRAGGISIGVNLSLDKSCNFHCVYCQVDRTQPGETEGVDLDRLEEELDQMVETVVSGRLFEGPKFCNTPAALRRLNDIALSGDGEPTAAANFEQAVQRCVAVRRRHALEDVKMVLITNATLFDRPTVRRALEVLDANGGEIWAKLDAGSEAFYRTVNRSAVPWQRILDNLREAAQTRPIVIQTLFGRINGQKPPQAEIQAYCDRLREILDAGGRIKLVQIHTVARRPTEDWVSALSNEELDAIADHVRQQTELEVATFYGG